MAALANVAAAAAAGMASAATACLLPYIFTVKQYSVYNRISTERVTILTDMCQ